MFHGARLKLTAWYLCIIMLISISFSVVIYSVLTNEVDRYSRIQKTRIERRLHEGDYFPPITIMDPELIEETKHRLVIILIFVNAAILILSGGLGYILAGRTLRPIQDMLDEQNRFITDSSHELRTPLTSLKSALEVNLRDTNLTLRDAKIVMTESIQEINKLQSLADELLLLAQYQTSNGHTTIQNLSLAEITKEVIHAMEPLAKLKKITIKTNVIHGEIEGNKEGLTELLTILLDNAIKYSTENKFVRIDTKRTDGSIMISVKDEGIGIPQKDISHVFDRFYRTDGARSKTNAGGYGLGLSIAKQIVDIHHGEITVQSREHKGATILVRLPVRQAHHKTKSLLFS